VVDYKTAATSDPALLDQRVEGYRLQGASYALTVATSTDEPVSRVTFLFLTPDGAVERDLSGLDATVADVPSGCCGRGKRSSPTEAAHVGSAHAARSVRIPGRAVRAREGPDEKPKTLAESDGNETRTPRTELEIPVCGEGETHGRTDHEGDDLVSCT